MLVSQKTGTAELLFSRAHQMGLQPAWVVRNGLFAISVDGKEEYVNFARSPLNSAVSVSLASNKHLTRLVLQRHGIHNIPFVYADTLDAAEAFLTKHTKIVAKPISGSGARDIHIVTSFLQLNKLKLEKYILEKYIVGREIRYLVLNGAVIAVHESEYGSSVAADRSLQRISYPLEAWDAKTIRESLKIADILGLQFAAVDYLVDNNVSYLLEVNSMPGLKWFHAPTSGPIVDVARSLLETLYIKERNS